MTIIGMDLPRIITGQRKLRHICCAEFSLGREFCATTLVPQDVSLQTFAKDAHIVAQNSQAVENSAQLRSSRKMFKPSKHSPRMHTLLRRNLKRSRILRNYGSSRKRGGNGNIKVRTYGSRGRLLGPVRVP
jgi:hypothetical protein